MKWLMRSARKRTGGLLKTNSKKKKYQRGRDFLPATAGAKKIKSKRSLGGTTKRIMTGAEFANIIVGGKAQKAKIISVLENKAGSDYIRRNIITKGAIINTDIGKARVTSRPGQTGMINAVLIEK